MLWFVAEGNTKETEDTGHRKVRSIFTFARQCNNRVSRNTDTWKDSFASEAFRMFFFLTWTMKYKLPLAFTLKRSKSKWLLCPIQANYSL